MDSAHQIVHRPEMNTEEILRLYSKGFRLVCRYCKVEFATIPESLMVGQRPQYVACPNNPNHMTILSEPTESMQGMRELMAQRKANQQ
jgi:hypothetical protein